jgi:hypothetical protein
MAMKGILGTEERAGGTPQTRSPGPLTRTDLPTAVWEVSL